MVVTAAGERGETAKCVRHQTSVEEDLAGWRMPEHHYPWARGFLGL
jgi:hypothetical protein